MSKEESDTVTLSGVILGLSGLWGFSIILLIAWIVYSSILYSTFERWSGISPNQDVFNIVLFLTSLILILGLNARYEAALMMICTKLGYHERNDGSMGIRNFFILTGVLLALGLFSGILLLATMAFFVGTLISFRVSDEPDISSTESMLIVPLFVIGVTLITLVVGEGIKKIDYALNNNSDDTSNSQKIEFTYNVVFQSDDERK